MIRVVVYNVSGGQEWGAVRDVLTAVEPDVVCLIETPPRFALRRIARRSGLEVAVRAGSRRVAVAVLTGERVRMVNSVHHDLSEHEGSPGRAVAQAIVGVGSARFAVFAAQFGLDPEVRSGHRAELEQHLARVDAPVVLGLDPNEPPGGPNADRLGEVLVDAFETAGEGTGLTFPNPDPIARKTFLFVDRSLAVLRAWVPHDPPVGTASHHRPVVVELAEPGEEPVDGTSEEPAA